MLSGDWHIASRSRSVHEDLCSSRPGRPALALGSSFLDSRCVLSELVGAHLAQSILRCGFPLRTPSLDFQVRVGPERAGSGDSCAAP